MLMPKANRVAIYEQLFKEGVMVAKKDFHLAKHPDVPAVPNLHVIKALTSLKSRGYVSEQFAWRHYYWYLTNEGIQYLRDFFHLPPEIVPATLRRQTRPEGAQQAGGRPARPQREGQAPGDGEGRQAYRRAEGGGAPADKQADAGAGAQTDFQFRAGYGRGRGAPAPQQQ